VLVAGILVAKRDSPDAAVQRLLTAGCSAELRENPATDLRKRPRIPESFVPVAAMECRRPSGGNFVPFVATNSMPTLADAFRLAHKTGVPAGLVCAPYADRWLPLLLADAQGDLVTPTPPLDGCGHIRPEVRAARTQLVFRQAG
jgi:hypothetical protein